MFASTPADGSSTAIWVAPKIGQRFRRLLMAVIICEALALLILGQRAMSHDYAPRIWLVTWLVGLGTFVLLDWLIATRNTAPKSPITSPHAPLSLPRWILLAALAPITYFIWFESKNLPNDANHLRLAAAWIGLMLLPLAIIAWPIRIPGRSALATWTREHAYEIFLVSIITLGAFLLRYVKLGEFAWVFSGDEGKFAGASREVIEGRLRNPFSTTFDAQVSLWMFVQGAVMYIFGDDVRGARMLSSLMGTATIPLFYVLIRRQFNKLTATISAILLATFHFHIFMSRDALNNISSPFFMVLSLLLLDQLLESWSPSKAMLLGIAMGLGQYAYLSNRLIVPIVFTVLVLSLLLHRPRQRDQWIGAGQSVFLMVFGFVLAIAPLAAYYNNHPENLNARFNAVSVFASGWLDSEMARTGASAFDILRDQFQHAALVPFTTYPAGYYIIDPPFIGWPLVVPAAIGLAIITANALRYRYLPWSVTYWAVIVGVSLTIGSPELNRFAMGALIFPLIASIGVVTVATLLRRLVRLPRSVVLAGVIAFLFLSSFWNVRVAFNRDPHVNVAPGRNTTAINIFSKELNSLGPGYTIYFAGAPTMFYGGLPDLNFLAKGDTGIDVLEPWGPVDQKPEIVQPTYFWFIPERRNELAVIESWFPGGELTEHVSANGEELFTTYLVMPDSAFPEGDSDAPETEPVGSIPIRRHGGQ